MSLDKIQDVKNWPTPTTVKEVQAFISVVNFNRQFIMDFSKIAIPLTDLTKKENPFIWTDKTEKAFNTHEEACMKPPVLVTSRSRAPTVSS